MPRARGSKNRQTVERETAKKIAAARAELVKRYRHAQLSAIKLAGDINAKVPDSASLDELIAKLKGELHKLAPNIDLDVAREPQGSRTEGGSTVESRTIQHGRRSRA
jgi:hypothetical protein